MIAWLQPRQLMYVDDLCRWRAGGSAQVYLQPRPQQVRLPRVQIQAGQKTLSALKCLLKGVKMEAAGQAQ